MSKTRGSIKYRTNLVNHKHDMTFMKYLQQVPVRYEHVPCGGSFLVQCGGSLAWIPDPSGVDGGGWVDGALDLAGVHVAGVGGVGRDAMVLLDQGVEHVRKHLQ